MTDLVQGEAAAGFEPVRAAFEANFREGLEVGAAVCIFRKGERVVDLWGGYRDLAGTTPWTESTLVNHQRPGGDRIRDFAGGRSHSLSRSRPRLLASAFGGGRT